jgi:hypothetical protein
MKRISVFISIAVLIVLAGAGTTAKYGKSAPNSGPNWFSVQASDLKLWVADTGMYGGWYQDNEKGMLFHLSTPRSPDHFLDGGGLALHSNPTNDGGYYGNGWNHWAVMPAGKLIPVSSSTASVAFYAHWSFEQGNDGVELQIATSDTGYTDWEDHHLHPTGTVAGNGFTFPTDHWVYTGVQGSYGVWETQYTCDLTPFIGKTIKLRFRLKSDDTDVSTGFLVDHLQLLANGSEIAFYGFEGSSDLNMWVTDMYWGTTVLSLWTEDLLFQGEVIAGASSGYVVDVFGSDWQAFGQDYGPPLHLRQTNRWTAPANQPKFDLDTYYYAPSGSGGGKFIIADCYLKRINDDVDFGNSLYIALHMEPRVDIPFEDVARYNAENKMIWLNHSEHLNLSCMAMMYLAPNGANPYAARITNWQQAYWGNDASLYSLMSVPQFDNGPTGQQKSYALISAGPYASGDPLFQKCYTKRFTFAFVAGDNSTELFDNATNCRNWYNSNLASNPQSPVRVAPTSLGNIKALYQQ